MRSIERCQRLHHPRVGEAARRDYQRAPGQHRQHHVGVVLARGQIEQQGGAQAEGLVHQPGARLVAAFRQPAEAEATRAVHHQRTGQLARVRLGGQVDLAVAEQVTEEAADVGALGFPPAHRVAHAPDQVAPRRGREHVVGKHRVRGFRVAREADRRQHPRQRRLQRPVLGQRARCVEGAGACHVAVVAGGLGGKREAVRRHQEHALGRGRPEVGRDAARELEEGVRVAGQHGPGPRPRPRRLRWRRARARPATSRPRACARPRSAPGGTRGRRARR